ncbi:MAG: type II secretion system major pseudopilin GspG [bacterium]
MTTRRSGFSFIEILVVVAIISILATTVGLSVYKWIEKANVTKARNQIGIFSTALQMYNTDNARFPSEAQGLAALCTPPAIPPEAKNYQEGGYINSLAVPNDPWGNEYVYTVPGPGGKPFEIVSYGRDGEPGGEGVDADISSLDL